MMDLDTISESFHGFYVNDVQAQMLRRPDVQKRIQRISTNPKRY